MMHENERATVSYHVEIHQAQGLVIGDRAQVTQWYGDAEAQRRRVEAGVAAERAAREEARLARAAGTGTRFVGVKPDAGKHFLDRDREREQIGALLADPSTQLITLVGQGGMGKTALACKALDDLVQLRRDQDRDGKPVDGIVYMSTRTAGISLERVFQDCARMLGGDAERRLLAAWASPELSVQVKVAQLLEALSDGRFVVLLDNLDDLLDAAGRLIHEDLQFFLEQSLRSGQGAALLATTRRDLRLAFDVQALDEQLRLDAGLPAAEGVALLRKLDRRGRLRGLADGELAQAVTAVHGVPRALQLIPSLLAGQPAGTGLAETMQRFYGSPEVVKALIEENYRRLTVGARQVMDALAVLRRPVPIVAVDYLLEPFAPGQDVPALLAELVAWSIVSEDYRSGMISLHPVDQDYAYSRLPDEAMGATGYTRQALERRAAAYYRELRTPEGAWKTIDDLAPQLTEFEHLVRAGDYDQACKLLNWADEMYLSRWGYFPRLVRDRKKLLGRLSDPLLEEANAGLLAQAHAALGELDEAIEYFQSALTVASRTGNVENEGRWLSGLGQAYHEMGKFDLALEIGSQAVVILEKAGDRARYALHLGILAKTHRTIGNLDEAFELHTQALEIAQGIGDRRLEAWQLVGLGNISREREQLQGAVDYYQESVLIFRKQGDRWGESYGLGYLGNAYRSLGKVREAIDVLNEALTLDRQTGDRLGEAIHAGSLGRVYRYLGEYALALELCQKALQMNREIGSSWGISLWLGNMGRIHYAMGNSKEAIHSLTQGIETAREIGYLKELSRQLIALARVLVHTEDLAWAWQCCSEALSLAVDRARPQAKFLMGVILLRRSASLAAESFKEAAEQSVAITEKSRSLFKLRYLHAAALVGTAVCDERWSQPTFRNELLSAAMSEYRQALEICRSRGIVEEAMQELELFRALGIKGLEPVFDLLEGYTRRHEEWEPVDDARSDDVSQTS